LFKTLFEAETLHLDAFDVTKGIYPKMNDYEAFIMTGSKYSAYDTEEWILTLTEFIRQVDQTSKKVIGICFGHQILANALGGRVEKNGKGWEVGWTAVEVNEDGQRFFKKNQFVTDSNPASSGNASRSRNRSSCWISVVGIHSKIRSSNHVQKRKVFFRAGPS
jgi:GMP synthase-like glutamine amidotransferase